MTDYKWLFSARPGKDNTRNRKFPFQKVIPFILAFRGGTLNHEIMDFFGLDPSTGTGNVKKCAVGKHPKSEKLGSTGQAACCARIHSRYFTGGNPSGLRV